MSGGNENRPPQPPDYRTVRLLTLKALEDGAGRSRREVVGRVVDLGKLTEVQENLRHSGGESVVGKQVGWSLHYLGKAGLIDNPRRGVHEITEVGKQFLEKVLAERRGQISNRLLRERCPEYREWHRARKFGAGQDILIDDDGGDWGGASPESQLERACKEIQSKVEEDLLNRLRSVSPASFEHIVIDLLQEMGYGQGKADWGEVIGGSGDGGIDGVIREDALGLGKIYMQAKRYDEGSTVGRNVAQQFVGALAGKGVAKGVFVTTSSFTKAAREYADRQNNIVWIDGEELVRLMIQYRVGVVCGEPIYVVEKVDENYFSEEDI